MNKLINKSTSLLLALFVLSSLFMFGCSDSDNKKANKYPTSDGIVKSANSTGMCYDITLSDFTDNFNSLYEEKTGKKGPAVDENGKENQPIKNDEWTVIGKKGQKDGKVKFTYYTQMAGKSQLMIAVDDSSKKVISVTTATTNLIWQADADKVEEVAVIASITAGKYKVDNFKFFKKLYQTSISGNCYYDNAIYKIIGDDNAENQDDMVIKLISLPATEKSIKDTEYTDYKKYKEKKVDFGKH